MSYYGVSMSCYEGHYVSVCHTVGFSMSQCRSYYGGQYVMVCVILWVIRVSFITNDNIVGCTIFR